MDTGQVSQAQAQPSPVGEWWERSYDLEPQISETSEERRSHMQSCVRVMTLYQMSLHILAILLSSVLISTGQGPSVEISILAPES